MQSYDSGGIPQPPASIGRLYTSYGCLSAFYIGDVLPASLGFPLWPSLCAGLEQRLERLFSNVLTYQKPDIFRCKKRNRGTDSSSAALPTPLAEGLPRQHTHARCRFNAVTLPHASNLPDLHPPPSRCPSRQRGEAHSFDARKAQKTDVAFSSCVGCVCVCVRWRQEHRQEQEADGSAPICEQDREITQSTGSGNVCEHARRREN